ncbi:MAG TPA: SIS domain-containing protein [Candidatus Sulfomarinibacteraceae bacterium]|nr:SIS domain-containing protein [Candidatus Sulfomarinibacteraceae bacterium]
MRDTGSLAGGEQQEALLQLIDDVQSQGETVVTADLAQRVRRIYLVGCGDSYFAALAVRLFYQRYVGLPVEPLEAMEFSRYVAPYLDDGALVVGVSNSGRVSRTVEAVRRARQGGAITLAATAYAERPLAAEARAAIIGGLPNVRATLGALEKAVAQGKLERAAMDWSEPGAAQRMARELGIEGVDLLMLGLGAYYASVLILYLLGLRLAQLRGLQAAAQISLLDDLRRFPAIMQKTAERQLSATQALGERLRDRDTFLVLGAGPAYAVALLAAAKLFEQPHLNGVPQQLEEWAHQQFFFTRPGTPIFFITPLGASRDRALEQMAGARDVGATVIAVCDADDADLMALADHTLPIYGHLPEPFSPLTYAVPGQLFAFAMLQVRGQPPLPPPYTLQKLMEVNHRQIYQSKITEE